eukprot:808208-Rhodomonas_salina.1
MMQPAACVLAVMHPITEWAVEGRLRAAVSRAPTRLLARTGTFAQAVGGALSAVVHAMKTHNAARRLCLSATMASSTTAPRGRVWHVTLAVKTMHAAHHGTLSAMVTYSTMALRGPVSHVAQRARTQRLPLWAPATRGGTHSVYSVLKERSAAATGQPSSRVQWAQGGTGRLARRARPAAVMGGWFSRATCDCCIATAF